MVILRGTQTCFAEVVIALLLSVLAHASSSTHYEMPLSLLDEGGQVVSSPSYSLLSATVQAGEIGLVSSSPSPTRAINAMSRTGSSDSIQGKFRSCNL